MNISEETPGEFSQLWAGLSITMPRGILPILALKAWGIS